MKVSLAALTIIFACSGTVNAQNDLGDFIKGLAVHSQKSNDNTNDDKKDKTDKFLEGLSNIFNKNKIAKEDDLVGTWKFSGPAIIFDSDKALNKMGGKIATQRMEDRITELLNKYDLFKSAMELTFDSDKNFVQTYKKLKLKGTYSVEDKNVILKYAGKYEQLVGDTQIDGKNLVIVMDIDKLNEHLIGLAQLSPDPKAQMICKLLSSIKNVKCGMRFEKIY